MVLGSIIHELKLVSVFKGSIISVVGKSTVEIMEPFLV